MPDTTTLEEPASVILEEIQALRAALLAPPTVEGDALSFAALAGRVFAVESALERLREDLAPLVGLPGAWRAYQELGAERVQDAMTTLELLREQVGKNTQAIADYAVVQAESSEWKRQLYYWTQRVTYALNDLEKQVNRVEHAIDPIPQLPAPHERSVG